MLKFLLLSFFGFFSVNYAEYCDYENIYEIRNQVDIDNIENCTHFNGSLFINGEYNIQNLDGLSNLRNITG